MPVPFKFSGGRKLSRRASTGTDRLRPVALGVLLIGLAGCYSRPNVFSEPRDARLRRLTEERLRLEDARDPVGRTRVQIRISDLLVSFIGDAVGANDLTEMEARLDEYRIAVTDARDTMMNSGRDALRQAAGFRDLEIALRQHMNQLDDIGSRLPVELRDPIVELVGDVSEIRDELFTALFPDPA